MDRRPFMKLFGMLLEDMRAAADISPKQLAKPIGMNSNTYGRIISGQAIRRDKYALVLFALLKELNSADCATLGKRFPQSLMRWKEEFLSGKEELPAKEILDFFLK